LAKPTTKPIASQSMISAEQFLAVLEEKDLLPKELLASIRSMLAHSQGQITAVEIAQMLIAEGYFTPALAEHFLGEVQQQQTGPGETAPKKEAEDTELGFAQLKEEPHPRLLRGKLRAYKLGEKEKEHGGKPADSQTSKPSETSPSAIRKKTLLDQTSSSPWSTSIYERERDSYKGLVSYRLAKLAEAEEKNPPLPLPTRRDWSWRWISVWAGLALLLIIGLVVWMLIR
jgi:hypothetical protein